ncbi:hypothetical protein POM88_026437 [Heracleum sosnowskyi]|uniref:Uncharacterized protein n=1 Tax=Heracleum sosnowskyi TaxID=360622 RepID=A0AAD8I888_9APIA|nr:hypothetical protein POM88_026437 [Heracleum sosnowskyi]
MRTTRSGLQNLLLLRTYRWCEAIRLLSNEDSNIWNINPVGAILRSNKIAKQANYKAQKGFYGFIDGSWRKTDEKEWSAGIGGYLHDANNNLFFFFSQDLL